MLKMRGCMVWGLALVLLASSVDGQDEKKKKRKRGDGSGMAARVMSRFKKLDLAEEQVKKMREMIAKATPSIMELRKEMNQALTPEQRKARAKAMKEARQSDKKGTELMKAVNEAAGIGDDVLAKVSGLQKKMQAMNKDLQQQLVSVLTDDQKAKMKPARGKKGAGKKGKRKKKADKKKADKKKEDN